MQLRRLKLINYRSYAQAEINLTPGISALVGRNGSGKTNMLDAIHMLCNAKSYLTPTDVACIRNQLPHFALDGEIEDSQGLHTVRMVLERGRRKQIKVDDNSVRRLTNFYGQFPCIFLAPRDAGLVELGGEERRKWLNATISAADPEYLQTLIDYETVLAQRNSFLKQSAHFAMLDNELLAALDTQLCSLAKFISVCRRRLVEEITPMLTTCYAQISGGRELLSIDLQAQSTGGDEMIELLMQARPKDFALQRTTVGIHRDDILIELENRAARHAASQGQIKSIVAAMKLAQHQWLRNRTGKNPILLIDDFGERLDSSRLTALAELLSATDIQLILSDASPRRIMDAFGASVSVFGVEASAEGSVFNQQ